MEHDLKQLYSQHRITLDAAMNYANNKRMMQQLLQGI
jgi:Tfp pilus assembly pilus retraction ATPase PilT